MKLSIKLTLLFLTLSVCPLSIVGFTAYQTSRRSIEQNTTQHLTTINRLKKAEIDWWIRNKTQMLRSLARRPLIRAYARVLASVPMTEPLR